MYGTEVSCFMLFLQSNNEKSFDLNSKPLFDLSIFILSWGEESVISFSVANATSPLFIYFVKYIKTAPKKS